MLAAGLEKIVETPDRFSYVPVERKIADQRITDEALSSGKFRIDFPIFPKLRISLSYAIPVSLILFIVSY